MLRDFLTGFGLLIVYYVATGLPPILLRLLGKVPFEVTRKMYHFVLTLSIFPLLRVFSAWYLATAAPLVLALILYPVLALLERSSFYARIAVERKGGEFKTSLIFAQLVIAALILIFWGLLGAQWRYVAVVAMMVWGFGDAAAALVGKAFGRRRILHRWIEGTKTLEGTLAMFVFAGLAAFLTLLLYAGLPWTASLIAALCVAPVSAAVELFSHRGTDTLTVPLSAAFVILPLMAFASLVGL